MNTKWIKAQTGSRIYKYFSASNENIIFYGIGNKVFDCLFCVYGFYIGGSLSF